MCRRLLWVLSSFAHICIEHLQCVLSRKVPRFHFALECVLFRYTSCVFVLLCIVSVNGSLSLAVSSRYFFPVDCSRMCVYVYICERYLAKYKLIRCISLLLCCIRYKARNGRNALNRERIKQRSKKNKRVARIRRWVDRKGKKNAPKIVTLEFSWLE